ncbi:MAG: mycofactocin-coupled SDR family oxidoreductase [Pseudonocardiaceae bacterium]|nr:mycofactocin-coupled SDR family oxidoreductase [Pseudonocardiaceae bacterium]
MGRLDGKVAFITGAARGQGRSHAVTLAREGADIVAVDINRQIESVPYAMAAPEDLAETARQVEDLDRRIVTREADVRDYGRLEAVVDEGLSEFGHIDIICANAGIGSFEPAWEMTKDTWEDMIDTNLSGVWYTVRAALPSMVERGQGGSIIITSSIYGVKGPPGNLVHYAAAKHGVVGIMRNLANELAPHWIRVNTVNPTFVATDMVQNETVYEMFLPESSNPTREEFMALLTEMNSLPIPWVEVNDISNAVLWLASDESRYVTGTTMLVDAGTTAK